MTMQGLHPLPVIAEQCLDCRIERRMLAVPLSHVDQLIEYHRHALPLSRPNVAGIGVHEGRLIVSLSLRSGGARTELKTAAVLFRNLPGHTAWALEVDETFSFIDVVRRGVALHREPWITQAILPDGASRDWLDVVHLVSSFTVVQG